MTAVKNILKHVSGEVAGKRRKCYRHRDHIILKGEPCLVVHDGPQSQTTYCAHCAAEILGKADNCLEQLHAHFAEVSVVKPTPED